MIDRRKFIKTGVIAGAGIATAGNMYANHEVAKGKRVGMIGLDTSHSIAFSKTLNDNSGGDAFLGYKVVAAYPHGSLDIESSVSRIPGYTEQIKGMGIEIVDSIESLLQKSDVILLETNDGRRHFEQAIPVLKSGKRMFIDKPMAASLADTLAIFNAASHYKVPVFSCSSLRYIKGMDEVRRGDFGKINGADTYSPSTIEKTHPDLFWYGIHGVETLFAAMGTGCATVSRVFKDGMDMVTGIWSDNRIGTFRGIRTGRTGFGGIVFCEKEIKPLGPYEGYNPLLLEIVKYFDTGIVPFPSDETIEIMAFMEAADESKKRKGRPVSIESIIDKAKNESNKLKF